MRPRVLQALEALASDPLLGKPLVGELKGLRSYRVWPYRILYEIRKRELIVLVVRIGHRQGVYGA
jgi:mRNA interferase RelE/StbE